MILTPNSNHGGLVNAGKVFERPLNIHQVDPIAPNFDAVILAAVNLEQSVSADPSQISGPHQPCSTPVKIV